MIQNKYNRFKERICRGHFPLLTGDYLEKEQYKEIVFILKRKKERIERYKVGVIDRKRKQN